MIMMSLSFSYLRIGVNMGIPGWNQHSGKQALMTTAPDQTSIRFTEALEASAKAGPQKTGRTRFRLLASMARQLMNGVDRRDLKVADVAREAGLAHGTFYRYFSDVRNAMDVLIEEFAQFVRTELSGARQGEAGTRTRVHATMLVYARLYAENAPLMRCLVDLGTEPSAFAASYQKLNRAWYERMAQAIKKRQPEFGTAGAEPQGDPLAIAYALGGMVDDFLAQVFLRREPALAHLAGAPDAIADLLTSLWMRAAYGELPESEI
jgi:AcrR family transcriptional regulator